jgi:hypothetical protein
MGSDFGMVRIRMVLKVFERFALNPQRKDLLLVNIGLSKLFYSFAALQKHIIRGNDFLKYNTFYIMNCKLGPEYTTDVKNSLLSENMVI